MFGAGAARHLLSNRCGAVAAMAALILPALIGAAGFGFDVGYWYWTKRNFQGAADAAAISAAVAYAAGNVGGYVTEARAAAAQHGATNGQNGVTVNVTFPYTDGTTACPAGNDDCLQVKVTQSQSAIFARAVGIGNPTITAQSVAQVSHQTYCMLALDQGNVTGIDLTLIFSNLNMPNCSIGSNATGANSFELQGFLVGLTAYTATLAGSFNNSCFICGVNWTHPIKTNAGAPYTPITDPYASRTVPTPATATTIAPVTSVASCSPGTTITASKTLTPNSCYLGINISGSGITVTAPAGNYTILSSATTQPAISVANGATLTMNAGNYQILGITKNGTLFNKATSQPAISLSGSTSTITIGNGTNTIQGGSGAPAINVTGGTLTIGSTNNSILGQGSGQPAISVGGGTFTMGSGTDAIQGGSNTAAITVSGTGNFITLDGGTYVIGPPTPTTYAISVNTSNIACGFGFGGCTGRDLNLGAGTYTIMGGINVTGGNLTLNPTGTSIGTYIMDGGGGNCSGAGANVGLCITFGDLNGQNSTIVLTGSGSNYATTYTQGADGLNLTAPQTGSTAGLAIFQDRNAPSCTNSNCNLTVGVSFLTVTGALYFPAQALNFLGVTVGNLQPANGNICLQMIADTINITGLAYIDDQCPAGVSPIVGIGTGLASLVE